MLVRGGRLVSHTQESESRPVWGNTFLECLRRPQQHVESCDKPPLLLPSPRIGPKQNVCDMFCISEKKMERVVHGEAPGSSPRSGGRMFATYFASVKKVLLPTCWIVNGWPSLALAVFQESKTRHFCLQRSADRLRLRLFGCTLRAGGA